MYSTCCTRQQYLQNFKLTKSGDLKSAVQKVTIKYFPRYWVWYNCRRLPEIYSRQTHWDQGHFSISVRHAR